MRKISEQIIEKINKEFDATKLLQNTIDFCSKQTENPPGREHLLNKKLIKIFTEIGCQDIDLYEKEKGRSNLVGRLKGMKPGKVIAIVGHSDVVPTEGQEWDTNPFEPKIVGDKLFGRGSIDNKGPFASTLEGVRIFSKIMNGNFAGEILLVSSADEEAGSKYGIKYLFQELGVHCDYALIPDGGDFKHLIYGEMGILQLEFRAKGKAFHGSMPERGINAIAPIAQLYLQFYQTDWSDMEGDGEFENAVLNLGLINGGVASNIVPEYATFNAMWRYPINKAEEIRTIDEKILERVELYMGDLKKNYPDVKFTYKVLHKSVPYLGNKKSKLFDQARESAKQLKLPIPKLKTIRAETVAKYINQACGAEVLVNGPMDGSIAFMHQPNEFASIKSLNTFAKYYALLLYNLQK